MDTQVLNIYCLLRGLWLRRREPDWIVYEPGPANLLYVFFITHFDHLKLNLAHAYSSRYTCINRNPDILPVILLALESPTHSLVDACLGTLSVILPVLDFSTIKHDLFPVVATVFTKTSSLGIKVRGLEAMKVLCGGTAENELPSGDGLDGVAPATKQKHSGTAVLDKYTIQEKVVPLLKAIKTKEPGVMVSSHRCTLQAHCAHPNSARRSDPV